MNLPADLLKKLESGALVLTANKRLSRYLESQYESLKVSAGVTAWMHPSILPFEVWCHQQYNLLPDSLPVISRAQGLLVWEKIVDDSIRASAHALLQVAPTAEMAWKAEQLLVRYQSAFCQSDATEDQSMFLQWQAVWRKQLEQLGMVDSAAIPGLLSDSIDHLKPDLPTEVVFAGFDDFDPSIMLLQQRLESAGCEITHYQPDYYDDSHKERLCCPDRNDEIRSCALAIRKLMTDNPELRIGVVAPNLKPYREHIERIFQAVLDPQGSLLRTSDLPVFNISESPPLADVPIIHFALRLLRLNNLVDIDELGLLLRSPYLLKAESACFERAACDRELKALRRSRFRLDRFPAKIQCDQGFSNIVEHLSRFARTSKSVLPGEWAERFSLLLEKVGWPGERTLSSREYQAVERFRQLLNDFASLDCVAVPLNKQEAASRLSRLASDIEFQPEGADSSINIIGMLEASGMQFDFLWILGMHAGAFPAKPHPNPFIPSRMQFQQNMPHANASRELEYSRKIISRLYSSAPTIVVSWPKMEEGMPHSINHIIKDLPARQMETLDKIDPTSVIQAAGVELERLRDASAPPITSRKTVSGGTSIIKDQAICPFRAFAHHRLRSEAFDEADIGIDALTRGSLVHKVLEIFWNDVRLQKKMLKLDNAELRRKVDFAAAETVENYRWKIPEGQRQLEVARLARLALTWLEVEKQRSGFEVIESEQEHTEKIGRLQIKAIIDRIDRLDNGQLAIIDYKTGRPDPAQWFDDRITEPQMPIYCQQIDTDKVDAVTFAIVRPGQNECKFKGVARETDGWPGISEKSQQELLSGRDWNSFDEILENWRVALPILGDAFMDGVAVVDPYDREKACRYCDLVPLCRIHEAEGWAGESNDG